MGEYHKDYYAVLWQGGEKDFKTKRDSFNFAKRLKKMGKKGIEITRLRVFPKKRNNLMRSLV